MAASCSDLLWLLWQISWQATAIVVLVLILRLLPGRVITSRWRHALWGLVLLRLVLPVLPQSRISLFGLTRPEANAVDSSPVAEPLPLASRNVRIAVRYGPVERAQPIDQQPQTRRSIPPWQRPAFLVGIWLSVALSLFARRVLINFQFKRRLEKATDVPARLTAVLDSARKQMRVRRSLNLVLTRAVDAPAVAGVFRPKILLPTGLIDQMPDAQVRLVLLHELSHIKCHDVAFDWVWAALQSLHWFNPVLWLTAPLRWADRELARDEMVLSLTGADEAEPYGRILIDLAQRAQVPTFCPGLIGIFGRKFRLQRRIETIARFNGKRAGWAGFAVLSLAGSCTLTSPRSQPSAATLNAQQNVRAKPDVPPGSSSSEKVIILSYDVNDLLFAPPDYASPKLDLILPSTEPGATDSASRYDITNVTAGKAADQTSRQLLRAARLDEVRRYVIDNVDPQTWKDNGGNLGSILVHPPSSELVITQTGQAQKKIQNVLNDLRQSRIAPQISVEVRYIILDDILENKIPDDLRNRLAAVRNAGMYRRDEFLSKKEATRLVKSVESSTSATILTAPRLTLFNGQHAKLIVQTLQAYVADINEIRGADKGNKPIWAAVPIVKNVTSSGLEFDVVACTSPDRASAFVDLDTQHVVMSALIPEQYGTGHSNSKSTVQRPVVAEFKLRAACGISDGATLLLGGSIHIDSGDPNFNASSPDRAATDAKIEKIREQVRHRHEYLLIKPTILPPIRRPTTLPSLDSKDNRERTSDSLNLGASTRVRRTECSSAL